jgi:beta-lactamase regulating signal transducer with metallopeptidase domain/tetratricopeptide (TPR) repeat protein
MTLTTLARSPLWIALGWTFLHTLWSGLLVGLLAAILRRALHRGRPETRYAVALGTLILLTLLPIGIAAVLTHSPTSPRSSVVVQRAPSPIQADLSNNLEPQSRPAPPPRLVPEALSQPAPTQALAARVSRVVAFAPAFWLVGSLLMVVLFVTGLIGADRMRRRSRPIVDGPAYDLAAHLVRSLGVSRPVRLAVADHLVSPLLVGVVRPLLLLPPAALSGWSVDWLEMALSHELIHLRRHDNLVNLLQRLVESFLFFHPVTWWLSAWIRLERELCCDAAVTQITHRPADYARLLAALADAPTPPRFSIAAAMSSHPVSTRIRRILDKEVPAMRITLPEWLSAISAILLAAVLSAASLAQSPPAQSPDPARTRAALTLIADRLTALTDDSIEKRLALASVGVRQASLGDRQTLEAVIARLEANPLPPTAWKDPTQQTQLRDFLATFETVIDSGDRPALARLARLCLPLAESITTDDLAAYAQRFEESIRFQSNRGKSEVAYATPDEHLEYVFGLAYVTYEGLMAAGDTAGALRFLDLATSRVEAMPEGLARSVLLVPIGRGRIRAGQPEIGNALVARARREILERITSHHAPATAALALLDLDGAGLSLDDQLGLLPQLAPRHRRTLIRSLTDSLCDTVRTSRDPLPLGGIKILIGRPNLVLKNPATAREPLSRLAQAATTFDDPLDTARTLAAIAPLQAQAGDMASAFASVERIPDLHPADPSAPDTGFHESIKPAIQATVAAIQHTSGDTTGATAAFDRALALVAATRADDQKLIASIVVAQKLVAAGQFDRALALVAATTDLASRQPEPRRSRVLAMLAVVQSDAGDRSAAMSTTGQIRNYPPLDRVFALSAIALRDDATGQSDDAADARSRLEAALKSAQPDSFRWPLTVLQLEEIGPESFVDYDREFPRAVTLSLIQHQVDILAGAAHPLDERVAAARAMNDPNRRDALYNNLATELLTSGRVDEALTLADAIQSTPIRINTYEHLAAALTRTPGKP